MERKKNRDRRLPEKDGLLYWLICAINAGDKAQAREAELGVILALKGVLMTGFIISRKAYLCSSSGTRTEFYLNIKRVADIVVPEAFHAHLDKDAQDGLTSSEIRALGAILNSKNGDSPISRIYVISRRSDRSYFSDPSPLG